MAIFDIFKKKKIKEEEKKVKPKVAKKPVKKAKPIRKPKEEKPKEVISEPKPKKVKIRERKFFEAWKALKPPQITEKATRLAEKNQYTFKVWPRTNKTEIKKAIEDLYEVDVLDVKIIKVPSKQRRLGRISGWRKGYKKAIVKIKEGQKIEVLPR